MGRAAPEDAAEPAPRRSGLKRRWFERGTLRNPGPHLDRMPVAFDLSGISLAEGLRAALASGAVLVLSMGLHSFPLLIAAFAANLTCFCDTGGLLKTRVRTLLFFTVAGALVWSVFGVLRGFGWPVVVPVAGVAIFLCSMARVWGLAAQAVGNVLIVVIALSLDEALGVRQAGVLFASFIVGGLWAVLVTLVIWRINVERPAMAAVSDVWRQLSRFSADLRTLLLQPHHSPAGWEAHARTHRRATRGAIEDAYVPLGAAVRSRGPTSPHVRRTIIRFEAAESVFAALIALSDVLESSDRPPTRDAAVKLLRVVRPVLVLLAQSDLTRLGRFQPALDRAFATVEHEPDLSGIAAALLDGVRIALRAETADTALYTPALDETAPERSGLPRVLAPLRDNLTWSSAILRHAVRATALTVPAMAWAVIWWSPYAHWLTITVALTMQPYFAATWQRVVERVGGTVLGGLIGAALAFLPQTPLVKALILLPLCVVGFSVRQVSYGAYIACLTPLVVVLFDVAVPGHSETTIAGMRLLYTVVGGVLALVACLVLWPTWEPDRLRQEMRTTLLAHARFAEAVFATILGGQSAIIAVKARRLAGVATNNLEASLSRSLQEPRRSSALQAGLVLDATIRRIGGALITLQHESLASIERDHTMLEAWRDWVITALTALADGDPVTIRPPSAPAGHALERMRRGIEVIEAAVLRSTSPSQGKTTQLAEV